MASSDSLTLHFAICISLLRLLVAKHHSLGGLNNRNLFLTALELKMLAVQDEGAAGFGLSWDLST